MKNTSQDIQAASAMLERARQILELTYHDWRLHEPQQRRGKAARKQGHRSPYDLPRGFTDFPRHNAFA